MMEPHPIASIYPLMVDIEFEELKSDIRQNGLRESIWIYENKILDGRNRYRACTELGMEPATRMFSGTALEAIAFVVSLNEKRRHLTSSQRAMCEVKRRAMVAEYAKVVEGLKAEAKKQKKGRPRKIEQIEKNLGKHLPNFPDEREEMP